MPNWLTLDYQGYYNATDLEYDPFCIELFAKLEAAKRDNFPKETMRIWFMEFLKRSWNKAMVLKRYEALLGTKIYGVEKLEFADWVNAIPVYAEDEINLIVKQRINSMIQRGKFLLENKERLKNLTDKDKELIDLALMKEVEFEIRNEQFRLIDEYKIIRRKELKKIKLKELGAKK